MNLRSWTIWALPALTLLSRCARSPADTATTTTGGGTPPGPPTFTATVQPIFTASCATGFCHTGDNPAAGMNLSAGAAYSNTINVPANELGTMMRIRPGQPDSSYLIHKIQGTHLTVGGIRARMPLGGPYLSDSVIALVRTWVTLGAKNN